MSDNESYHSATIEIDRKIHEARHLPADGYHCAHDCVRIRLLPHPVPGGGVIIEVRCPGQPLARRHVRADWLLTF